MSENVSLPITKTDVEIKIFRNVCLVTLLFCVYAVLNDLILGSKQVTLLIDSLAVLLFSLIYYFSASAKKYKKLVYVYLIFSTSAVSTSWFTLGGLEGSIGYVFLTMFVLYMLIIPKEARGIVFLFLMLLEILLVFLENTIPEISLKQISEPTKNSIPFTFVASSFCVAYIVLFLKSSYDRERELIHKKNSELDQKSQVIEQQNEELRQQQEEIIKINESLEEKVKERTEELEKQKQQLTDYAFINAHQLRAPLARIMGLVYVIELEESPDSAQNNLMRLLKDSTKELDMVVRKINQVLEEGNL